MDVIKKVYVADPNIFIIFGIIVALAFPLMSLWNHFASRICVFTREPHYSYAERILRMINGRWAKWGLKVEGEHKGREAMASIVPGRGIAKGSIFLGIKSYKSLPAKIFHVWQPRLAGDAMIENHWVTKNCLVYYSDRLYITKTLEEQALTDDYIKNQFDYLTGLCEKFERGELEPR